MTNKYLWVTEDESNVKIGLSEWAKEEFGEISFLLLPSIDQKIIKEETTIEIEAEKATTELPIPFSGIVLDRNETAINHPATLSDSEAWLLTISKFQ